VSFHRVHSTTADTGSGAGKLRCYQRLTMATSQDDHSEHAAAAAEEWDNHEEPNPETGETTVEPTPWVPTLHPTVTTPQPTVAVESQLAHITAALSTLTSDGLL